MAKQKNPQGVPIVVVTAGVFAVMAFLSWGILAGSYAGATSTTPEIVENENGEIDGATMPRGRFGRRVSVVAMFATAVITFVGNAFVQLPNILTVFSWHFSHRIWLPIFLGMLQLGVIAGGFGMQQLEQTLWEKPKVKRRKMATPKVVDYD